MLEEKNRCGIDAVGILSACILFELLVVAALEAALSMLLPLEVLVGI